jgi:hypothetical protein
MLDADENNVLEKVDFESDVGRSLGVVEGSGLFCGGLVFSIRPQ